MSEPAFQFPVVGALVARHAEDAAFYWSQLDRAVTSPQVHPDRLAHFDRLLESHLDGLDVAASDGWKIAWRALERWHKAGEAFVCTWLALREDVQERLDAVLAAAARHPDQLLRGIISALARSPRERSLAVLRQWSSPGAAPPAQVAALRAAALLGRGGVAALSSPLLGYFTSADPHVRAAALRAAGSSDQPHALIPALHDALTDAQLPVRAEAAIALARQGHAHDAVPVLCDCVLAQSALHQAASGWNRSQASRRLVRWTMELAWMTPPGDARAHDMLASLPPRPALTFALCHGDLAVLPFVIGQMADPEVERYAGWVWQTLTGIDLTASGCILPEPAVGQSDTDGTSADLLIDIDNGLARPDLAAIKTIMVSRAGPDGDRERVLLGRKADLAHALALLDTAPQAVRVLAARLVNLAQTEVVMNVRAPEPQQRAALRALHEGAAMGRVA